MRDIKSEITEAQYNEVIKDNPKGFVTDKSMFFSEAMICGYGVYGPRVVAEDGKYFLEFAMGDSCD